MKHIILCAILLLSACDNAEKEASEQRREEAKQADQARLAQWAYIAKEKQVTATETVKLLIIPSKLGKYFDTKCYIYSNAEYKQSNMVCGKPDDVNLDNDK